MKRLYSLIKLDVFKSLSVYTAVGFFQKAFPIILLPFLTRVLTPKDYGLIAMFASIKTIFAPFISLGSTSAIERYYFDRKEMNFPLFLTNILFIILVTFIFFGSILLLIGDFVYQYTQIPKQYLWVIILISLGLTINRINQILYRVQNKSISFALMNLYETGAYFIFMLFFVYIFKYNWRADVFSQTIIYLSLGLFGIWSLNKQQLVELKINKKYIISALSFGLPMFIHSIGLFFVNMIDKVFITKFIGIDSTGLYNIGFKMATILVFFITAFNNAYVPWLFGKLKNGTKKSFEKAFKSTILSGGFVALLGFSLIILLPYVYPILIGKSFSGSLNISKVIVFGEIFNSFYLLLVNYILFSKSTKYVMFVTLITSLFSVLFNYILIKRYGIDGAAYTLVIVYFAKFLLTLIFVYILYKPIYNGLIQSKKNV